LKKFWNSYGLLLSVGGVIVLLDQITKTLVRNDLMEGEMWSPWTWLLPYIRVVHIQNSGAAFGMLPGLSIVFTILSIIVVIAILYFFPRVPRQDWVLRLALCLQFGGALGNLIDRLHQGYVTDFVSFMNFAVFNVADACISIGVAILILDIWFKEKKKDTGAAFKQAEASSETSSNPTTEDVSGE
jgi:signal peptidase II